MEARNKFNVRRLLKGIRVGVLLILCVALQSCGVLQKAHCEKILCAPTADAEPGVISYSPTIEAGLLRREMVKCSKLQSNGDYGGAEACMNRVRELLDGTYNLKAEQFEHPEDWPEDQSVIDRVQLEWVAMKASWLLDLRRNFEAYRVVSQGLQYTPENGYWMREKIRLHRLAGIAAAFFGDLEVAQHHVRVLERTFVDKKAPVAEEISRNFAVADIYMAMGSYQSADAVARRKVVKPQKKESLFDLALNTYMLTQGGGNFLDRTMQVSGVLSNVGAISGKQKETIYRFKDSWIKQRKGLLEQAATGYRRLAAVSGFEANYPGLYMSVQRDLAKIAMQQKDPDSAINHYLLAIDRLEKSRRSFSGQAAQIAFQSDHSGMYSELIELLVARGDYAKALEIAERGKCRALVEALADRIDLSGQAEGFLTRVPEFSVSQFQQSLPPDQAVVYFYASDTALYSWSLTRQNLSFHEHRMDKIAPRLAAFLRDLRNPGSEGYFLRSRWLHEQLLEPLKLAGTVRKIWFVPSRELHYLPFAALHDGAFYLIDNFEYSVLPNLSILQLLQSYPTEPEKRGLVLGNPESDLPSLTDGEEEARQITTYFDQSRVLLRQDASEAQFRNLATTHNVIHIASHASYQPYSPMNSSLSLARGEGHDGQLTLAEIYGLRLNAELVTLAACETGTLGYREGDEIMGLNRGFLYAGTKRVMASLWQVSDEETALLMEDFYRNWQQQSSTAALQLAQLRLRQRQPHPYYWAAFQINGL